MPEIATPRLTLRPLAMGDAPRIAELAGEWDVARMTTRIPHPYDLTNAENWLTRKTQTADETAFAIALDDQFVGGCGFIVRGPDAELGYWLGKPYWGRGYATEAAGALIDHVFQTYGVERITLGHFVDNPASACVIEKLGFVLTGHAREDSLARGTDVDVVRYALARQSWQAQTTTP